MPEPNHHEDEPIAGDTTTLNAWQLAVVDLFVHAVQAVGLPRSVGQIYGYLYAIEEPATMDDIKDILGISKGSTSQGLKMLRQFGAVRSVFVLGTRREHFVAENSLRRLVSGFISEVVEPHMTSGSARLEHIKSLIENLPEDQRPGAEERLVMLRTWHDKATKLIPLLRNFL